ncbi:FAD-dependent oxidoreductase [Agromyces sp. NPDC058484]|uniref:FAD-dependent oxidoreductase n=1 Tax=Agromyces sp. NPDC058484 TaxID=3346524 RepID=UPI00364D3816
MGLRNTSVESQVERAADDPLRVLVVGAGIAGVSLAQSLRHAGWHPVVIERARDERPPGYMLALMPMVDPLIDDLGIRPRYLAESVELGRYAFRSHAGRALRTDSMAGILDRFGDYRGITRGRLLETLADGGCDVAFETTVAAMTEHRESVTVSLVTDGVAREREFDLVVVADGIRSSTRELIPGATPIEVVDTGWAGWVVWAEADADTDLAEEIWGAGFILGTYPVKGRVGVFLGGPADDLQSGPAAFVDTVRAKLTTIAPRVDRALRAVADDPDPYYWALDDGRAARWTTARTVLLGDAAAGFLPTAGIGAGMAMESAWVLGRLLRHTPAIGLGEVLTRYEAAQRPRVEAAQDNSRQLARYMFSRSRAIAVVRETTMRLLSVEVVLRPIRRLLEAQPDPGRIASGHGSPERAAAARHAAGSAG